MKQVRDEANSTVNNHDRAFEESTREEVSDLAAGLGPAWNAAGGVKKRPPPEMTAGWKKREGEVWGEERQKQLE